MRVPERLRRLAHRPLTTAADGRARRPGYDATEAETLRRVLPMLRREPVVWLSTVTPEGLPHIVPTWFWWDGEALVVFSKPGAVKARNLRARPRLMVALGHPEDDFAVALIEGEATCLAGPADVPQAFFDKYASALAEADLTPSAFRATYTQAIRIAPTRFLPWHGRGARHESAPVTPDRRRAGVPARRRAGAPAHVGSVPASVLPALA